MLVEDGHPGWQGCRDQILIVGVLHVRKQLLSVFVVKELPAVQVGQYLRHAGRCKSVFRRVVDHPFGRSLFAQRGKAASGPQQTVQAGDEDLSGWLPARPMKTAERGHLMKECQAAASRGRNRPERDTCEVGSHPDLTPAVSDGIFIIGVTNGSKSSCENSRP
jgi:hypothetical protein